MTFSEHPAGFTEFWCAERHYATLTTRRPDGTPHVVPVSVSYDPAARTARVLASRGSKKVRNIAAAGEDGMRVALCQVDGRRWATLEGHAHIRTDPADVADGERRFEQRYGRAPRANPERVLVHIAVDRLLGRTH